LKRSAAEVLSARQLQEADAAKLASAQKVTIAAKEKAAREAKRETEKVQVELQRQVDQLTEKNLAQKRELVSAQEAHNAHGDAMSKAMSSRDDATHKLKQQNAALIEGLQDEVGALQQELDETKKSLSDAEDELAVRKVRPLFT
jgi:hypothetical protein